MERLISIAEAAAMLNLKPQTLRIWHKKRKGPPVYRLGRVVRYDANEVRAFIESCKENK